MANVATCIGCFKPIPSHPNVCIANGKMEAVCDGCREKLLADGSIRRNEDGTFDFLSLPPQPPSA